VSRTDHRPLEIAPAARGGSAPSLPPCDDPRLVRALDEDLAALEAGAAPERDEFLARHPEIAGVLADCLGGLAFIRAAAPRVRESAADGGDGPKPAPALHPESPLGDYRIVREVGRGGMGVVYEAVQLSLGRHVALKVLPFAAAFDPQHLERFKHEAQAAARLHHTNIVPVFGVGCERGLHFYAMQYIEGQSVAELILDLRATPDKGTGGQGDKGNDPLSFSPCPLVPLSPCPAWRADTPPAARQSTLELRSSFALRPSSFCRTVAQLGIQAAQALEHAHQLGVVHRDIKPANLLVDVRGNLWVTDFGLAQLQGDAGLTRTGDLVGTLRYMSPEQVRARPAAVDHRTDVYSLGATLYELLGLEPAFAGNDRNELAARIACEEPRPLRRLNRAVPVELETIVHKAMDKDPAERYATAQELADDLRRFLEDRPIRAKRPTLAQRARKWSRRHKAFVVAAAVTVGALLAAGGGALVFRAEQVRAEHAAAQAKQEKELAQREKAVADEERELARRENRLAEKAKELAQKEAYSWKQLRQVSEYNRIADLWLSNRPHLEEEERTLIEQALRLCQELAREQSDDPQIRLETGKAYRRVGDLQQKLGRHAEAEEAYGRAVALLEALVAQFPAAVYCRYELACDLEGLGQSLLHTGRPREAEQVVRRSLALYEQLRDEFANEPSEERLDVLLRMGSPFEAENVWRQSAALRKQVVAQLSKGFRSKLARAHNNLGLVLAAAGRRGEAERAYEQARALQERLAADDPDNPGYRHDLAGMLCNRGDSLRGAGRYPESRDA